MGLLSLMWLTAPMAYGQTVTLTKGNEGKSVNAEMLENGIYICSDEGVHYWLTRCENGPKWFTRPDDWQLLKVDVNFDVKERLELPQTNHCGVAVTVRDEDRIGIVLVDSSERSRTDLLTVVVRMDTLALVNGKVDTLASYKYDKKDHCYVWSSTSNGGAYWGVLALVEHPERREYETDAMVYDAGMRKQWRREYAVGTVHDMKLSDRGDMVTLGLERLNFAEQYTLNLLTPSTNETYQFTVGGDPVIDMQIANVLDRKAICMGTFAPQKSKPSEKMTGGVVVLAFDLDSVENKKFTVRQFENEDVNILLNKKTKKVQKDREVPMVTPLAVAPTSFGAVMALGHRHVLRYKQSNGTVSTTYYAQGIHLVAVDGEGDVKWVRNVRRNDVVGDDDALMYMALFENDGTVCMVKKEHKKYPSDYNIAKEAKEFDLEDKGNLVLYCVDDEGEVKKYILEQKTKHSLLSAGQVDDDKTLLMTAHGSKTRMIEMEFLGDE